MKPAPDTLGGLRRQVADMDAALAALRAKLAKAEAAATGQAAPVCGLDLLWAAALPMSRMRSSKQRCRQAWSRLPATARPTVAVAVAALKAWNKCDLWYANDNLYAPGLHRFISERMWETLPESAKPAYRRTAGGVPQPVPVTAPEDQVTDPEEIARLLGRPIKALSTKHEARNEEAPPEISDAARALAATISARSATRLIS